MLVYLFSGVEMTCRSTRIDPATRPKILGPEMQGGPGMRIETTSHAERRRCQVAVWIQEENGSFRISVYCLSCLCWYLMVKNHIVLVFHHHYMNPPKSHVFLCFTQWIRPFDPFWLLVSTGFWDAWATPLGFLGPLVVSIKPHVLHGRVVCVVAAMKTWRRCDGGRGPQGEDETNGDFMVREPTLERFPDYWLYIIYIYLLIIIYIYTHICINYCYLFLFEISYYCCCYCHYDDDHYVNCSGRFFNIFYVSPHQRRAFKDLRLDDFWNEPGQLLQLGWNRAQFTNDFASNSNPTPLPLLWNFFAWFMVIPSPWNQTPAPIREPKRNISNIKALFSRGVLLFVGRH